MPHLESREPAIILSAPGKCNWCGHEVRIGVYYCSVKCRRSYYKWWTRGIRPLRRKILLRDSFRCQICHVEPLTINPYGLVIPDLSKLDIDHIQPVSRGGGKDDGNLRVLCNHCNRTKHQKNASEHMVWLKSLQDTDAYLEGTINDTAK